MKHSKMLIKAAVETVQCCDQFTFLESNRIFWSFRGIRDIWQKKAWRSTIRSSMMELWWVWRPPCVFEMHTKSLNCGSAVRLLANKTGANWVFLPFFRHFFFQKQKRTGNSLWFGHLRMSQLLQIAFHAECYVRIPICCLHIYLFYLNKAALSISRLNINGRWIRNQKNCTFLSYIAYNLFVKRSLGGRCCELIDQKKSNWIVSEIWNAISRYNSSSAFVLRKKNMANSDD